MNIRPDEASRQSRPKIPAPAVRYPASLNYWKFARIIVAAAAAEAKFTIAELISPLSPKAGTFYFSHYNVRNSGNKPKNEAP